MSNHTPGPWEFYASGTEDDDGHPGFTVQPLDDSDESQPRYTADVRGEANARLIAAAPDLLTQLNRVVKVLFSVGVTSGVDASRRGTAIREARAAIAKVEGR